ncbi:elongation factor 1-gamma [Trypanosoma cruzi]|nr:elongation factor 1-gamma [Trypanosoma cruzi]
MTVAVLSTDIRTLLPLCESDCSRSVVYGSGSWCCGGGRGAEGRRNKRPNPLDELPLIPFLLEGLNRDYSHTDTRTVAAPYFFQHCGAAGHMSFWCHKHKDNRLQHMTANLIHVWLQHM